MVQKRACDACHKRKIQCDSTSPKTPCNWCEHHGLDCTFNRVRGRKRPPKPRSVQTSEHSLAERLRRIEDTLSQTISRQNEAESSTSKSPSSSFLRSSDTSFDSPVLSHESPFISQIPSPAGGFTTTVSYGQIHYGGCHFGQLSQHNGMLLLSEEGKQWITSKTDEEVLFEPGSQHFSNPAPSSAAHYYNNPEGLYALPDRDIVETLFDMFVNSSFTLVFPIVDRILFKDTIELAYQPHTGETTSLEQLSAKVCVLAFASIMSLFQGSLAQLPYIDTDLCATKARYLLTDVLEVASITNLQVTFMLNMHEIFSGRLRSAAMFHAIACRMIYTLGGHTNMSVKSRKSPINRSERERRQLRMLFWLCYIFDKDISLRTGQPPLMSDDYCDLTLPDGYLDCYNYLPNLSESLSPIASGNQGLTPHLPGDPRLSHIKERTNRLLYSAQAAKKTHAQLLQNIRELDEELEDWRVSIPPDFRPALSISDGSQVAVTGMHLPRSMRHITLHLEYHHLMTTIHRASGRCMEPESENSPDRGEWAAGVDSSMALALEASRSTLIYLKAAMCGLAGEAFWIIVFYPTAAMITLFFNLLMHPLDERAEQDLELLKSAADLVNSLPVQRLTPHEVSYMKDVNDFVLELVRLGRAAIAKATKEQDERLYIQMMSIH
ncbi:fungal-specific transcription factor domain-containing protein [Fusarium oxysporum]|nr:fungal-specific transcription factor domain-containing protein [Fusarium oxysporum]